MSAFLYQRQQQQQKTLVGVSPLSPRAVSFTFRFHQRTVSLFGRSGLLILLALIVILGIFIPWIFPTNVFFPISSSSSLSRWRDYTLSQAAEFVGGKNGTIIVCAVSLPYLPFLQNWLISISRQKHLDEVLVIAEDYATLYKINQKWPGHAVLIPPVPDAQVAHKFGTLGFFNFTSRRPRHLLNILKLGYNVMYNDVDMVWLADPFPYLQGNHDVYFTDDMASVKALDHPHSLPQPGKKGRTYICSCMIFLRPTDGAKVVLRKWIEELQLQPWSKKSRSNDQPAFNWALNKTSGQNPCRWTCICCLRLLSHQEASTSKTKHGSRKLKGSMLSFTIIILLALRRRLNVSMISGSGWSKIMLMRRHLVNYKHTRSDLEALIVCSMRKSSFGWRN